MIEGLKIAKKWLKGTEKGKFTKIWGTYLFIPSGISVHGCYFVTLLANMKKKMHVIKVENPM